MPDGVRFPSRRIQAQRRSWFPHGQGRLPVPNGLTLDLPASDLTVLAVVAFLRHEHFYGHLQCDPNFYGRRRRSGDYATHFLEQLSRPRRGHTVFSLVCRGTWTGSTRGAQTDGRSDRGRADSPAELNLKRSFDMLSSKADRDAARTLAIWQSSLDGFFWLTRGRARSSRRRSKAWTITPVRLPRRRSKSRSKRWMNKFRCRPSSGFIATGHTRMNPVLSADDVRADLLAFRRLQHESQRYRSGRWTCSRQDYLAERYGFNLTDQLVHKKGRR